MMRGKDRSLCVETAQGILDGQIGMTEGCRTLCLLCPSPEYGQWPVLIAFDSQTELFPSAERRPLYHPKYLAKLDQERAEWEFSRRPAVLGACEWIVREYGGALST
jgi:hypothetical protein